MASAMMPPIVASLLAEMVPTWAISVWSRVDLDKPRNSSTIDVTALSIPRLMLIGSWPAATILTPSA